MGKVYIKAILTSDDDVLNINIKGIKNKNKILYKENDINVTINIKNNIIELVRENDDYVITLVLEKNKNTYSIYKDKVLNKKFEIETYTKELIISDNYIKAKYSINALNFIYELSIGG